NEDILSTSRRFALQRQIMFYLCRKHTTKSYPEISLFFNKNHATIIFAYNKIADLLNNDASVNNIIQKIERNF
ncbi:MAG: hypothetical protein LBH46_03750, partial [Rickettsiales bacterium]|nr:hypothetical protein [Rickettsiales bacterium]